MPKVSIIMSAWNEEKNIVDTLNSILTQNFKDFEIIIVDDGSKDKTKELVKEFVEKDPRIKFFEHEENKGQAAGLNIGLDRAQGEYICPFDADDFMLQDKLKKQVEFLDSNHDIDVVYGDMIIIFDNEGNRLRKESVDFEGKDPKEILIQASKRKDVDDFNPAQLLDHPPEDLEDKRQYKPRFIPASSLMLRKRVFEKCRFGEDPENYINDYDMWLQVIGQGFKIKRLIIDTYIYRIREGQKSKNKEKMEMGRQYILKKLKNGDYFE